jgi:hypothetical protein
MGTLHARILNNVRQQPMSMYKQKKELKRECMCMFWTIPFEILACDNLHGQSQNSRQKPPTTSVIDIANYLQGCNE